MSRACSFRVSKDLFLVRSQIHSGSGAETKEVVSNVNHILVVDVSGSMWGEIDKVRDHIKTKIPKMMREGDTLSIIAFSGKGQCWRILTAEPVATLADLSDVNRAIDRWLRPVGLTGFKEPIEEATRIASEIKNKNPFSLFFLSDGQDNQWPRSEVLKAVEDAAEKLSAATVVSYGYYADLPFLTRMAEKWGGSLVVSNNFTKFSPALDASIQRKVVGGKKVEVPIGGNPIGGFTFSLGDGELVTFSVEGSKVLVPEGTADVWYLSPSSVGDVSDIPNKGNGSEVAAAYAAISLFAVRMRPDVVLPLLKATGDVAFIEQFSTLFGKQKYADFQEFAKKASFDPTQRLTRGYDPTRVPRENAYTVLEFLRTLQDDESNRVMLSHPAFKYNRIGRARVDSNTKFTREEQEELDTLSEELAKSKGDLAKSREVSARIAALTNKPEPLKFTETKGNEGYPVSNLVFNEDRPNISIMVRKEGTVDLTSRLPKEFVGKIPTNFPTFCFRNYAIVKDGLVNVSVLPVKVSAATRTTLQRAVSDGRLPAGALQYEGDVCLVSLSEMPVINRRMVASVSARLLFEKHWELTRWRAAQKVYNTFKKEKFPGKKSEGFKVLYGDDGAAWLAEQGITDYSGFGPKTLQAEAQDVYTAKCLEVKLKGYSSIPSMKDFQKQASKGKFNGPGELMKPHVEEMERFLESDVYISSPNKDSLLETWLEGKCDEATHGARLALFEVAIIKFSVVVGQVWFSEFETIDQNSMDLSIGGTDLSFSVEMREVEEKI